MMSNVQQLLSNAGGFYLFCATFGSVVFLFMLFVTLFFGGGGQDLDSADADISVHGHEGEIAGLKILSIKSVISFLAFFGWAGVFWGDRGINGFLISFGCGLLMMFLTSLTLWLLLKMQQSGNIRPVTYIGCRGEVYLSLPPGRAPGGKVTVHLPHCTRQIAAVADEAIASGTPVKVTEMITDELFVVTKIQ
ncbi:MAG: hypothetical protein AB7F32_03270 [Victivallaceae bacterium]